MSAEVIVNVARSQVGVLEDLGSNEDSQGIIAQYREAVRDSRYQMKPGDAYCAAFVSWVLEHAGYALEHETGVGISYVPWLVKYAKVRDLFDTPQERYQPLVGDVVCYSERGEREDHTGIVVEVHADHYISVEGNYNNGVNLRKMYFDDPRILGYFSPTDTF